MKGASEVGEITARSDAALAAGCDMILICNDPESAKTVLENQRWFAPRHLMKGLHASSLEENSRAGTVLSFRKII